MYHSYADPKKQKKVVILIHCEIETQLAFGTGVYICKLQGAGMRRAVQTASNRFLILFFVFCYLLSVSAWAFCISLITTVNLRLILHSMAKFLLIFVWFFFFNCFARFFSGDKIFLYHLLFGIVNILLITQFVNVLFCFFPYYFILNVWFIDLLLLLMFTVN